MKRFFLAALILAMLAPLFCACSGGEESDAEETEYTFSFGNTDYWKQLSGKDVSIDVYNWGEYISVDGFDVVKEFEKLTGINVNYANFASNEELYAKMKSGGSMYDVVIPSDYMISRLISEGMLDTLDFEKIPNFNYIMERFRNAEYDPENLFSVPYMWGAVGIIYNKKFVSAEDVAAEGWNILWDARYKGNILMFSNSRDAFGISLMRLGYSVNTENSEEIEEAAQELKKQKAIVQAYVMDEVFDKMSGSEAYLAPYYSGDALTMIYDNDDLAFYIPESGTNIFVDAMCIPKSDGRTADEKLAAEMFINFMCEPDVAIQNVDYIYYCTPHSAAYEYVLTEWDDYEKSVVYPTNAITEKSEFYIALSSAANHQMDRLWTDILSNKSTSKWAAPLLIVIMLAISAAVNIRRNRRNNKKQ